MERKKSKLEAVLSKLSISEKEVAKRIGLSVPMLQQLRRNARLPISDEKVALAEQYVREIATAALGKVKEEETKTETPKSDISDLQAQYEAKFDKKAPARYKNDAEWLKSKLSD